MIKAIIFDMDGVIVDSMPMHLKIWKNIFKKRKMKFSLKIFEEYNGTSSEEIAKKIVKKYDLKEKWQEIVKEKIEAEEKLLDKELKLFDDAIPSLILLRKEGYKIVLATSALKHMVDFVKKRFEIEKYFDAIAYSAEVNHTKPSPDIFLLAAKKLRVDPRDCVVIEDAVNGIAAAKSAGMTAVAITTTFKKEAFRDADFVINRLSDIDIQKIDGVKIKCAA